MTDAGTKAPQIPLFGRPAEPPRAELDPSLADAASLRKLLEEQKTATLKAQADAQDLEKRLLEAKSEAKAEASRTKNQLSSARTQPANAVSRSASEAGLMKVRLERSQKDLEREKIAHKSEAAQAQAKLDALDRALRAATQEKARESEGTSQTGWWIAGSTITALAILTAVLFATGYWHPITPKTEAVIPISTPKAESLPVSPEPTVQQRTSEPVSRSEFTQGISRLTLAFSRFSTDPEMVMREVNRKAGSNVCAFAWNDGQPALQFGKGASISLSNTLSQCAAAVEKLQ